MNRPSSRTRALPALIVAMALLVAACTAGEAGTSDRPNPDAGASAAEVARAVCRGAKPRILFRVLAGTNTERSGQVQMIPAGFNSTRGLSHASPFDYTQHVPLLLYGPGFIEPGVYPEQAGLVDIAPTIADLIGFDGFRAPDGVPLRQALLPAEQRTKPALVVTMIWDSAGMDLLDRWPRSWPYLRSLTDQGAWFPRAYLNSSPSNTPPSHASIGTGAYPRHHGIVDEYIWYDEEMMLALDAGPTVLEVPTLGDVYGAAMAGRAKVGGLATLSGHLMMMGQGTAYPGGQRQIAVTKEPDETLTGGDESAPLWQLPAVMAPFYRFPDYVNDPAVEATFEQAKLDLDRMDGRQDGHWRDFDIGTARGGFDTPARTPWQSAVFEEVIRREGFGLSQEPDLLFLNYKALDTIGHIFSADGVELSDGLEIQDRDLERFVDFLNDQVGRERWVLIVTADHGMQRDPEVSGAFQIPIPELRERIESTFGQDGSKVIRYLRPTELWLDPDVLAAGGHTLEAVSAYLMSLTQTDMATPSSGTTARPGREHDPIFAAALPSEMLTSLPCLTEPKVQRLLAEDQA